MKHAMEISKNQMLLFAKGIILGIGIIIPGISGGTILMAFGMYENLLDDLLKFYIKPYISMGLGGAFGVLGGSVIISYLFDFYRNPTSAFILGCVLMSIPFILKRSKGYSKKEVSLFVIGAVLSFSLMKMPTLVQGSSLTSFHIFIAGFISSSAMMIPGVSGSAVLIMLGIYENMLVIINELQFLQLSIFVLGATVGIIVLAKILKMLFNSHGNEILFFFAGLILGSSKILFPSKFDFVSIMTFILGIWLVYRWGNYKYRKNSPFLGRTYRSIRSGLKKLFSR